MKRVKMLFFGLVLLASILRFYQLGKTPISLEWDEVAIGYDAYSILHTAKDQFGHLLPLTFRSLDDYKPPLYVYATVPTIALFGLSEVSVRLPSALFGLAAVILTYYLVMELFSDSEKSRRVKRYFALLASLFLAISPWHLQFSRAAFETNASVTVLLAAVLFFLKGISGNRKLFFTSAIFFGLSLFSYHSSRVVSPILLLSLFLIFHKSMPVKKSIAVFIAIYALFIVFFIPIALSKDAQIRFRVTNVLNIEGNQDKVAQFIRQDENLGAIIGGKIFHNRRLAALNYTNISQIFKNYLVHFSPEYLFVSGDVPLHHAPGFGMMYFFDLPLLIIGLFLYIRMYRTRRSLILLIWLLLGPVPASVTWQVPHAVRSEIILPSLQIFSAIGLMGTVLFIRKESRLLGLFVAVGFAGIATFGIGSYLHQYYIHTNIELSKNWLYGRKEAAQLTEQLKGKYDEVVVSLKVDMPYIFWLFYTKYPPEKYLKEGGTVSGGFADERNHFDTYQFRNFQYAQMPTNYRILMVGLPNEFPLDAHSIRTIYYLDGTEALKVVDNSNIHK